MSIEVGDLIRGKYRVERVLGKGGMGIVLAAFDVQLGRHVAIKMLRPELLAHPEIAPRFLQEARAAARIQSDHVAQVLEISVLDSGAPFIVMEHLDGHDLRHEIRAGERTTYPQIVARILEACRAIKEAHDLGIVHRDLKPANLFLAQRRDGTVRVKVLDFGISKQTDEGGASSSGMTRTSVVMGSPEYMSPEQMLSSRDVDARSDIWSLGIILYELCTGVRPYMGETVTQVYARMVSKPLDPPRVVQPEIPPELDATIMACLVPDRDKRIASVPELMDRLSRVFTDPTRPSWVSGTRVSRTDHRPSEVIPTMVLVDAPSTPSPTPQPDLSAASGLPVATAANALVSRTSAGSSTVGVSTDPLTPPATRAWWPFAVGGVALVGAVMGAVVWTTRTREQTASSAPAASATSQPGSSPSSAPEPSVATAAPMAPSVQPANTAAATASAAATSFAADPPKKPTAAPTPPSTPAPKANCQPPYTVDAKGFKHAKPECL